MADKMADEKSGKIRKKKYCKCCDYTTSETKDYNKHILTAKHKRLTNADEKSGKKSGEKSEKEFKCDCGKSYMQRQSLFKHKKICTYIEDITFGNYNELLLQTLNNCDN